MTAASACGPDRAIISAAWWHRAQFERAVLLSRDGRIGARDLPMLGPEAAGVDGANPYAALDGMTVEGAERWLITRALERTGGNVSAAARALGLTRMAMRYRMDKYGL